MPRREPRLAPGWRGPGLVRVDLAQVVAVLVEAHIVPPDVRYGSMSVDPINGELLLSVWERAE